MSLALTILPKPNRLKRFFTFPPERALCAVVGLDVSVPPLVSDIGRGGRGGLVMFVFAADDDDGEAWSELLLLTTA